jgi:Na+/H+ antiporter NhaD/arsenite permease-like protein
MQPLLCLHYHAVAPLQKEKRTTSKKTGNRYKMVNWDAWIFFLGFEILVGLKKVGLLYKCKDKQLNCVLKY